LKGGGLLLEAQPATVHSLVLSDVIGNDLSVIASGPTMADKSTFDDAWQVVEENHLGSLLPKAVVDRLKSGRNKILPETIKPDRIINVKVTNQILASNRRAIDVVMQEMTKAGFHCICLDDQLKREAKQACEQFLHDGFKIMENLPTPALIIGGGETTVSVKGNGLGGRNLEFALAAVKLMAEHPNLLFFSLATDGEDGPTDAAGAIITAATIKKAQILALDPDEYLFRNDAYHFFEKTGGLIKTGSTGTNVNDVVFLIKV
jgi:hydroxypyruvate reductase